MTLDPYSGPGASVDNDELTGRELRELVAFYKRTADQNGEPYDPEWDRWIEEDRHARYHI